MRSNNVYLPRPLLCLYYLTYFRKWCHVFTKSLIEEIRRGRFISPEICEIIPSIYDAALDAVGDTSALIICVGLITLHVAQSSWLRITIR